MMIRKFVVLTMAVGLCAAVAQAQSKQVYWTTWSGDYTGVWRANVDGTGQEQILSLTVDSLDGVAVDVPRNKLYISTGYDLLRSDLDGSGLETIVSGVGDYAVYDVHVDSVAQKVYWSTRSDGGGIRRANLDGSGIETVYVPPVTGDYTYHMDIDQAGQKLYFAGLNNVYRADLDGANPEALVANPGPGLLNGMGLDVANGKMYFTTWPNTGGAIYQANLDGSDLQAVVGDKTADVAVDTKAGKIYWPAWAGVGPSYVMQANLDGTDVVAICPLQGASNSLEFVPEPATLSLLGLGGLALLKRRRQ
ncbi:MAG: PEP-CTERM sorting domain-containing protein [Planctomycetota bacterium]|jgi:hypothetical protein